MVVEKIFDTGSLKINFAEGPIHGAPLVLLHGATARWQDLNPLIAELERHWHVYACDLRGHGKSDRAGIYRAIDFFPDIAVFIQNCIGAPTVLAGHSLGGVVSIGAIAIVPDLVRSLILLDPPLYLREESIRSNYAYDYFTGVYSYLTKQRTAQEVFTNLFPGINEEDIGKLEAGLRGTDPEFLKTVVDDRIMDGWDMEASVKSIICPTLMLHGEVEKGSVVRDSDVEFLRNHVSQAEEMQIKGAGHLLQVDQPARVLESIAEFTQKHINVKT